MKAKLRQLVAIAGLIGIGGAASLANSAHAQTFFPFRPDIVPVFKSLKGSQFPSGAGLRSIALKVSFKGCQATSSTVFLSIDGGSETRVVDNLTHLCDVLDGSGFLYGFTSIPQSATRVRFRVVADSKREVVESNERNNILIIDKQIPPFPQPFEIRG